MGFNWFLPFFWKCQKTEVDHIHYPARWEINKRTRTLILIQWPRNIFRSLKHPMYFLPTNHTYKKKKKNSIHIDMESALSHEPRNKCRALLARQLWCPARAKAKRGETAGVLCERKCRNAVKIWSHDRVSSTVIFQVREEWKPWCPHAARSPRGQIEKKPQRSAKDAPPSCCPASTRAASVYRSDKRMSMVIDRWKTRNSGLFIRWR